MSRDADFSMDIKRTLCANVGGICSNPNCKSATTWPDSDDTVKSCSIGEAAHIYSAQPGGARYDKNMSNEQRRSYENGIWLCRNCHGLIDKDPSSYPSALLKKWKIDAEYCQYCKTNKITVPGNATNEMSNNNLRNDIQLLFNALKALHELLLNTEEYYTKNFIRYGKPIYDIDCEIANRQILYKDNLEFIYNNFWLFRHDGGLKLA